MIFHGMKILQKSWSCKDGTPLNRPPKKELAKIGMWVVQSHYSMKMASSVSCFCFVSFYLCFCFVLVLLFLFWFCCSCFGLCLFLFLFQFVFVLLSFLLYLLLVLQHVGEEEMREAGQSFVGINNSVYHKFCTTVAFNLNVLTFCFCSFKLSYNSVFKFQF